MFGGLTDIQFFCVFSKVFLMNLARQSDSKSVAAYFGKFGAVVDVKIFRFPNGDSRGVGTVEFTDPAVVNNLLTKEEKHSIDGRPVVLRTFLVRDNSVIYSSVFHACNV